MKLTKKAILMTSLISSALIVTACGNTENKEETSEKNVSTNEIGVVEKKPSSPEGSKKSEPAPNEVNKVEKEEVTKDSTESPNTSIEKTDKKAPSSEIIKKETVKTVDLFDKKEEQNYQATFHSGWKKSPSSTLQATIDGRGEEAIEEGEGILVIQNTKTHSSKLFSMKGENQSQLTPKFVEWIDDNRLYVIVGFSYGTVSKGGNLYELNLTNNTVTPIIDNLKENEEIISIKKNPSGSFIYEKHVYVDDNFNEGQIVEGTLPVSNTK